MRVKNIKCLIHKKWGILSCPSCVIIIPCACMYANRTHAYMLSLYFYLLTLPTFISYFLENPKLENCRPLKWNFKGQSAYFMGDAKVFWYYIREKGGVQSEGWEKFQLVCNLRLGLVCIFWRNPSFHVSLSSTFYFSAKAVFKLFQRRMIRPAQ